MIYKWKILQRRWKLDSTTVYGTLVRPLGNGPFPAVVIVSGSGPTDRDWNSPFMQGTNGSARLIAEALAEKGIASLRYDKRVSGPHARENMESLTGKHSMKSHLDELAGAVRTLSNQTDIRTYRLFGIGNSEGTLHLLNYQLNNPEISLTGLVLIGPPGRSVGVTAHSQLEAQIAGIPNGVASLAFYDKEIERFLSREPITPDPSLPQTMQLILQGLRNPNNLPFSRELWITDASMLLNKVSIPVLVIIGKKDIQIDWQIDGDLLQKAALGHENIIFNFPNFPENANHILKYEPKPRTELTAVEVTNNYNASNTQLDPDALSDVLRWLISFT